MNKKIILVTGASSKLGVPLVECLANRKHIVYAGVRDMGKYKWKNKNVFPIRLDVTSDDNVELVINKIFRKYKKLDCVINNAGMTLSGPTLDFTSEQFKQISDVNTIGAFRISKYYSANILKRKKSGKIINITSLNGIVALPNFGLYSATKFALEALSSSVRVELKRKNIFVTTIAPGAIKTNIKPTEHGLSHKPLRERFKFLYFVLKMTPEKDVINKIIEVVESSNPPARVIIGRDAFITYQLQRFLPNYFWDKLTLLIWRN
jgi:short-subunit dehydrogenase